MRNCVKKEKNMTERVVQTCCCCCAPTFHPYVVTCNIFVSWQSYLLTYLLTYISSTIYRLCKFWSWLAFTFLKCTKFDQLILRKIIKIVATRCHILTLKCTIIDFGWGSAPDAAGGAYSAPPDP